MVFYSIFLTGIRQKILYFRYVHFPPVAIITTYLQCLLLNSRKSFVRFFLKSITGYNTERYHQDPWKEGRGNMHTWKNSRIWFHSILFHSSLHQSISNSLPNMKDSYFHKSFQLPKYRTLFTTKWNIQCCITL